MAFLDLYLLFLIGGALLLVNGFRKRQRKDLYVHGSFSWMFIAWLPLVPLLYNLNDILEHDRSIPENVFIIVTLLVVIGVFVSRYRQEMKQKKLNVHNLSTDTVENIIRGQLERNGVEYKYEKAAGKRGIFSFPDNIGEIEVHSHYISEEHQRVTFSKTNEIPKYEEVFEGLDEESERRERRISKTLGFLDLVFGGSLLIFGIYGLDIITILN